MLIHITENPTSIIPFLGNFMLYKFSYYQLCLKLSHFPIKLEKRNLWHIFYSSESLFQLFRFGDKGANVALSGALKIANY